VGRGVACQEEFLAAGHAVRSSLARRLLYPPEGFHHKEEKSLMDKIALEEHIESPDFQATGSHNFTDSVYFADVEHQLQEYKLRLDDMDATGIETTILLLTQPGIEDITDH
jgi:hypothetical protein